MGLLDAFKKKPSEPALDLPPRPEDTMPSLEVPAPAEVDTPPALEVPEVQEPLDAPPAPEEVAPEPVHEHPVEPEVDAPPAPDALETRLKGPADELEELAPLPEVEKVEEPEELEMPEEIKPKASSVKDTDFTKRMAKIKAKVSAKEQHKKFESEMDRLRTENEYLKSRIEKLTGLIEALPISEIDARVEKINSDHRESKAKMSDMMDKLSVHSNLINETVSVRDEFEKLKHGEKESKKQIELLSESLDSYKNTLYMLNKKVELVDHSKRVEQVEGKIKEIIVYLNKITRIITKD